MDLSIIILIFTNINEKKKKKKSYVTVVEPVKIVAQSDSQVILNTTAKGIGNFFKAISKEVQKNLSESNNSSTPRPSKSANGTILKDPSEFIGVGLCIFF